MRTSISLHKTKSSSTIDEYHSLEDLLVFTRFRQAPEPRDTTNSLLGMLDEDARSTLVVDYAAPIEVLFTQVARMISIVLGSWYCMGWMNDCLRDKTAPVQVELSKLNQLSCHCHPG